MNIVVWPTHIILFILIPRVLYLYTAIPITIGLTKSLYYVDESDSSLTVCFEVLSGRTATRSISMVLQTVQGEATGMCVH